MELFLKILFWIAVIAVCIGGSLLITAALSYATWSILFCMVYGWVIGRFAVMVYDDIWGI